MKNDCIALILSAGLSERMGSHKALLKIGEITFIEKIFNEYQKFGCKSIIVTNPGNNEKIKQIVPQARTVINHEYKQGRFSSVLRGIKSIDKEKYFFLQNIDNPFVTTDILEKIYALRDENHYIVPVFKGKGGHPILIPVSFFTQSHTQTTQNQNLRFFLQLFKRKNVLINDETILANINTPKEYRQILTLKKR